MTMATKLSLSASVVPNEVRAVHHQFEQWRRTREAGARIPDRLWASAVAVARRHGVYRTARMLHLEARKLKHLVTAVSPASRVPAAPAFVELLAPAAAGSGECTVEVEGPRGGRLRVQLRGAPVPDLMALTRIVWGPEA
jgi:hypothetical protein